MDESGFKINIAVVGLGLIGASYAMALRDLGPRCIYGIDKNEETLKRALDMGIVDKTSKKGNAFLKEVDLIIVALYPQDTVKFIEDNLDNFKEGVVITDTSGIKESVVSEINSILPDNMEFVGGHPMAGKEAGGIKFASKDIFKGANYIITPTVRNSKHNLNFIEKMAKDIGFKNVIYINPEEHDRIISFTSQLPHVIAVSLVDACVEENDIGLYTGGSFRDATRVAVINSMLWSELFTMNSEKLISEIERFEESINKLKDAIKYKDLNKLDNIFRKVSLKRKELV
ncbi:prephenate dehydrogenase [Clostridiaceae bacterium UIB06]|uniref:Prephenate dehydrogenase n=1 Tax=Clostridium thailandense TaxID=2794346 RepID=A0A949TZU2_9CLOT|nr:prephenate dehydrogenase [Clostridium thailandense]MBV7274831.1 prephenate dehydrogenase [Clostridium thailandense]MCH5137999.1 prephenate dehydrogenase [Clostridiaceae bacterium UIB06]